MPQPPPPNATGAICSAGGCKWTACAFGWDDCNNDLQLGNAGNGCETETNSNFFNCGGCGIKCNGLATYEQARYYIPPPGDGEQCCNGKCISTGIDCAVIY